MDKITETLYYKKRAKLWHKKLKGDFLPEKYKTKNIKQFKLKEYPQIKGIYFCVDKKKNQIIYIGQSISIYARLASNPHFNHRTMLVRIMFCSDKNRIWYERRWILKFLPKFNSIPDKDNNYKFNPYNTQYVKRNINRYPVGDF